MLIMLIKQIRAHGYGVLESDSLAIDTSKHQLDLFRSWQLIPANKVQVNLL